MLAGLGWERWRLEGETHLERAVRLAAALAAGGGEVLPEEAVVDVAAAVEVEERRDGRCLGVVALALGLGDGVERAVEAVHVGLVVLGVVQLHDLARDVRLEGAVVVCSMCQSAAVPRAQLIDRKHSPLGVEHVQRWPWL